MKSYYDDIIGLTYPFPTGRKRMSMIDRAAQFSPFAALTGYDAAIQETGRLTDSQIELDVDGQALLDEKIRQLSRQLDEQPEIQITYFVPDERKCGGRYVSERLPVKKVDRYRQAIIFANGTEVFFGQILEIEGDVFQKRYDHLREEAQDV